MTKLQSRELEPPPMDPLLNTSKMYQTLAVFIYFIFLFFNDAGNYGSQ